MAEEKPSVLFVCVKNGGKSQMAEALMRHYASDAVEVHSAGTRPGAGLNELSAEVVAEAGADMRAGHPPQVVDPEVVARVDRVVLLGDEVDLEPAPQMRGSRERWVTCDPSERGIEGRERMRLIRDDIAARCRNLLEELTGASPA